MVGFTGNIVDNTACFPLAVGQKLLKIAGLGIWDDFCHPVHVFTRPRLHKTTGILPRFFRNIVSVGVEMVAETRHKIHKASADAAVRRLRVAYDFLLCYVSFCRVRFMKTFIVNTRSNCMYNLYKVKVVTSAYLLAVKVF